MLRSQLIDVLQGAPHRVLVGLDTQLRVAGEVEHAVAEKLHVLLERGARRKSRVVAAVDATHDQLAALRGDIAE
ncbi:hypothetical protein D3C86_1527870 [compost metagenome]